MCNSGPTAVAGYMMWLGDFDEVGTSAGNAVTAHELPEETAVQRGGKTEQRKYRIPLGKNMWGAGPLQQCFTKSGVI